MCSVVLVRERGLIKNPKMHMTFARSRISDDIESQSYADKTCNPVCPGTETVTDLLTVRVPGITGEARRLLMGWKVAAGTPATVFTITFPLTVAESKPGLNVRF